MSIRSEKNVAAAPTAEAMLTEAANEHALAEGSAFSTASPDNPLRRNLVVSIRASLADLTRQKSRGTWSPSTDALKSIFQQRQFTTLSGDSDTLGDLKSVVLHEMNVESVVSTFPLSLGTNIHGVDDNTYTATGENYSMVVLPNTNTTSKRLLQSDDVSLAYEFAKKFPGYTSENLSERGVHEVSQRKFVLVAADHPIVSAISENADKLQMGEIAMMPEGLVKISQSLYENILPLVKTQVESQIKVRDFSKTAVSITPAEYSSWADARAVLIMEAKRPLQAQLEADLGGSLSDEETREIRAKFAAKQAKIENEIDHKPMDLHLSISMAYNFLAK